MDIVAVAPAVTEILPITAAVPEAAPVAAPVVEPAAESTPAAPKKTRTGGFPKRLTQQTPQRLVPVRVVAAVA